MVLRTIIITISLILICFSAARFKADVDMKTVRVGFASRNIERALYYTKSAIKFNPTEIQYNINLHDLESIFINVLQSNAGKVVIRRRDNVQ